MSQRGVVVVGSHTDIGKTWVSCRLLEALLDAGVPAAPRKPVVSGFVDEETSDPHRLLAAARMDRKHLDVVSPLRFRAPIAPDAAARAEGRVLRLDHVMQAIGPLADAFTVLETAGGVMSPIAEDGLVLHLCERLALPTILVVGDYLGGISHALTAHRALHTSGIEVAAVVVNRARGGGVEHAFERFSAGTRVLSIPESASVDAARALLRSIIPSSGVL